MRRMLRKPARSVQFCLPRKVPHETQAVTHPLLENFNHSASTSFAFKSNATAGGRAARITGGELRCLAPTSIEVLQYHGDADRVHSQSPMAPLFLAGICWPPSDRRIAAIHAAAAGQVDWFPFRRRQRRLPASIRRRCAAAASSA